MRFASLLCAAIAVASQGAGAAIFNRDDRLYVSTAPRSVYSPIGVVSHASLIASERATGILVDECSVLTSQHVASLTRSPIGKRVKFTGAADSASPLASRGTVIAAGHAERFRSTDQAALSQGHDWMLVRLDHCLGKSLGFARLSVTPGNGDLLHVQNAGYPIDRSIRKGVSVDPSCAVTGLYALVWLNDCAVLPGNSGGPVFRVGTENGSPVLLVYAIETAARSFSAPSQVTHGLENVATPVSMILPKIADLLSDNVRED